MSQLNNRKVLLRIRNLKQYFPLKKKGMYVKANDGIDLDIYEGEVFGLVGESGCGKSTFGRTILQLYKQTDGRTMYYGKTLDDIAPKYYQKTIRNLGKLKQEQKKDLEHYEKLQAEYDTLTTEQQYAKHAELDAAKKKANDDLLDICNLIGGLYILDDFSQVSKVYEENYQVALKRREAMEKLAQLNASREDLAADEKSTDKIDKQIASIKSQIEASNQELQKVKEKIEELRKPYLDNEEFKKYDALLDDGIDLARLSYNEMRLLRRDLQIVFQDPYSSLNPRLTIGQIIAEGLRAHNIFGKNSPRMQEYILKVMDDCGLQAYFLHRFPHQFSGGQRQRISIARALAVNPRFVVCDEAVSALDVSIQSQIINLLQDLKEKQDLTYMFITHDLSVVKYLSDRIGVMYLGNMVELGNSKDIFAKPIHPYTQALINAIPTTDPDGQKELHILEGDIPSPVNPPSGCKFHTRCQYCTEICKQVVPEWREMEKDHFVACHHPLNEEQE
ncbi:MAG: ATP-binding cassette domain-containing protein [Erysipelotrichaceae bacterium]|nr:ATP-binding cassette domain-containing protein [Erysipelotrichaceae bacterium]